MNSAAAKINVLLLTSSRGFYGAEHVILNLIRALDHQQFTVTLATLMDTRFGNQELVQAVKAQGGKAAAIPCNGRLDRAALDQLCRLLQEENIDLLHCHESKSRFYGLLASRRLATPLVTTNHNWTRDNLVDTLFELFDAMQLRFYSRVIAVSETLARMMGKFGVTRRKIVVIPNGVDIQLLAATDAASKSALQAEFGLEPGWPVVATVGRLNVAKGQKYFLEAAAGVLRQAPQTHFLVVGSGELEAELKQQADSLGISERVLFTGFREDTAGIYALTDILVIASLTEGTPMVLLEAMAAKTAVVSTAVGGIPDILQHDENALLVAPKDVPALTTAVLELLQQPTYRASLIDNAYATSSDYSLATMARRHEQLYLEILERGKP